MLLFGNKIKNWKDYQMYISFFRYFPFGWIDKGGITTIKCKGKKIKMNCSTEHSLVLSEVFARDAYSKLNIEGKDVIDIGTALGDTTVYFGLFGARNVYGYEINKRYYDMCVENIELNNLKNKCKVELCGVGKTEPVKFGGLGALMSIEDQRELGKIPMKSLEKIINEHKIFGGILKVDVDGYEYEIFENADMGTISVFDEIFIEYHYGTRDLVEKLVGAGFKVNICENISKYIDNHPEGWKQMEQGYIVARK
ncbi:MAG: FkbM family methyltransferase [Patescibacteria group bacterium]